MANQKDKTSIFLTIFIIFLIAAMAIYGFIYRDKIGEYVQKITKKNEKVEKLTVKTTSGPKKTTKPQNEDPTEITKSNSDATENNEIVKNSENEEIPILPSDNSKTEKSNEKLDSYYPENKEKKKVQKGPRLSEPENEYFERRNIPESKEEDTAKLDFKDNLPSTAKSKVSSNTSSKKKSKIKRYKKSRKYKKRYYKKRPTRKYKTLEKRVSRLEKKLGIKKNSKKRRYSKKSNLEKRIYRLEKIVGKIKK